MFKLNFFAILLIASTRYLSAQEELHNKNEVEEWKFSEVKDFPISNFEDEIPTTYRLPNDSIPLGYTLTLTTDIDQGIFDFDGRVQIHVKVLEPTNVITLHYRQINVTKVDLLDVNSNLLRELSFYTIPTHEFLKVNLTTISQVDAEFILDIQYKGILREDGAGFYRAYYDVNETRVWYGTTQFEVTDARHAMPCYDEPGIRAPIKLTMLHSPDYKAVSNTPVESDGPSGTYHRTVFEATPRMQTYLLAFIVSPFEYVTNNDSRVEQRVYAKPSSIANGEGDFSVHVVKSVLEKFEEHLGIEFPIKKMDHAAITQFNFGAMENFGLITYTESGLLYNPNTPWSSQESRQMSIIRLIAHEYAHQWFGNIVSPSWWTYVWLNEGFATLFESYIPSLIYPNMTYMNRFVTNNLPRAFASDVGSSWAMNHYTEIPAELWSKFGAIGYQKSGCVLRMFQEALTPKTFAKGLNYYLNDSYLEAVTPQHLHDGLQRAYSEDFPGSFLNVGVFMSSWENQAGYPLLSVEISEGFLAFTQRRYPESNGEVYAIPLTFATLSDHRFSITTPKVWITTEQINLPLSSVNIVGEDWIVFNNQQVGYYRVDYSTELWHRIIKQLNENHQIINPINRAVLQDEIYMAWKNLGRLTVADVFESLRYLSVEEEPLVWRKAEPFLSEINIRLWGSHTQHLFRSFLIDITRSHLARIGLEAIEGESSRITELRTQVRRWSCTALEANCLNHDYQKWLNFVRNNLTEINFNFCSALTNLNDEMFHEILTGITTSISYPARSRYLTSLGCNRNYRNIRALLHSTINMTNVLTTQDRINVLRQTPRTGHRGMTEFYRFNELHYAQIHAIDPTQYANLLIDLTPYVTSDCSMVRQALARWNGLYKEILTDDAAALMSNEIRVTYEWIFENLPHVKNWLGSRTTPTSFEDSEEISYQTFEGQSDISGKDLQTLEVTEGLDALRHYIFEENSQEWTDAEPFLTEINRRLSGSHEHRNFKNLVKDITRPHLTRLGLEAVDGENANITALRSVIKKWNCKVMDDLCLTKEYEKWNNFFRTNEPGLPFDYCFALMNLNDATFKEILHGITMNANYPSRDNYLKYLGCNQNQDNLWSLLDATINMTNILTTEERVAFTRSLFQGGYAGTQTYFLWFDVYFGPSISVAPEEFAPTLIEVTPHLGSECSLLTMTLTLTHGIEFRFMNAEDVAKVNLLLDPLKAWNVRNYENVEDWFAKYYSLEPVTTTTPSSASGISFLAVAVLAVFNIFMLLML